MREKLHRFMESLSGRERAFLFAAIGALLAYATYAAVLEKTALEIMERRIILDRLEGERRGLGIYRQRLEEFRQRFETAEKQLAAKQEKERRMMEGLKARHHIESLIRELRRMAERMPLRLIALDLKTGVVSKSGEYELEAAGLPPGLGIAPGAPLRRSVKVDYNVSQIVCSYRSPYRGSVNYLSKVMELPYAISIHSVEMERGKAPDETLLTTKLGIEVYSR